MVDSGETDTKLIGVIDCDPRYKHITSSKDISQHLLDEIGEFFKTYKNLQKKSVNVKGFKDVTWANREYLECVDLMKKYGQMDKDEFVKMMQKKYPNKYR
jgi:inorganic pyrophosphatase